jgi:hypothetical protein
MIKYPIADPFIPTRGGIEYGYTKREQFPGERLNEKGYKQISSS